MDAIQKFAQLKSKDEKALLAFLPGNYPTKEGFEKAAEAVLAGGADILEIGIPFSDPLADGQIIADAYYKLVESKENLDSILATVSKLNKKFPDKAFVVMSYANPLLAAGRAGGEALLEAGVSAVIVPDIPFEERKIIEAILPQQVKFVAMLAPTTSKERTDYITTEAQSFVYCVAVTGVTGERNSFESQQVAFLDDVRSKVKAPLVIGFGISQAEHAKAAANYADGVVIGSKLTKLASSPSELRAFIQQVKAALITR